MTIKEASERYNIPMEILREYEGWGLCGAVKKVMGAWQYDDTDLERLSLIMTLHDIGFGIAEIETYMRLLLEQEGQNPSGCGCSIRKENARWMRFIFAKSSSSAWTICAITSEGSRKKNSMQKGGIPHENAG